MIANFDKKADNPRWLQASDIFKYEKYLGVSFTHRSGCSGQHTTVQLKDGDTLLISGLIQHNAVDSSTSTPGLPIYL
ncbi:hypothetical protein M2263_004216 [Providencia alcalifaciens]|nr:hypothetical protein [Providencia alcalifaciens]